MEDGLLWIVELPPNVTLACRDQHGNGNEGRRNSIGIRPIVKGFLVSHRPQRVRHLARTEYVCNPVAIPEIPRVPTDSRVMTKDHLCERG